MPGAFPLFPICSPDRMTDPRFRPRTFELALDRASATPAQTSSSAALRAYELQLKRVQKLKSQLGELETLAQGHRTALAEQVAPLRHAHREALRELVRLIDGQLNGKRLAAPLRKAAVEVLCGMAGALAREGDQAMAELHDRHAAQSLAQVQAERARVARAEIEAALGQPLDDVPTDASEQAVWAAGMARLRQQREDEAEQREAAKARRKARKAKPAGAVQEGAETPHAQASDLLRALFRRLASALHPDREPDPEARARKTRLMGEANAAYARKDLTALMALQQDAALADPEASMSWSDDRLATMTVLLKAQVAELERQRARRQDALCGEFEVGQGLGVTPGNLRKVLNDQVAQLEQVLDLMARDLALAQTDEGFKRWLRQHPYVTSRRGR